MAGLEFGSFRFSNDVNKNKSYIHLKLTESAQKALDEHFQLASLNRSSPIVISGNGGEGGIKIPGLKNAPFFKFIEQQKNKGADALADSFECVHQSYAEVLSKGALKTVRLQATDDSYENTRQSMANVMAQNGKNCIKELKQSNNVVRHRPTRPTLVAPPRKEPTNLPLSHYSNQNGNNSSNANSPMNGISRISKTSPNNPPRLPPPPMKKPHVQNAALIRKPIKERIIHLLALRPMKKLEIIHRLHSDGVKEVDKKRLSSVIHNMAILKDNAYHLQKHLWAEVQDEWPFYSEEDKNLLKKNKSCSVSPPSPVPRPTKSEPSSNDTRDNKRQRADAYEHSSKRTRVARDAPEQHRVDVNDPKRRRAEEVGRSRPEEVGRSRPEEVGRSRPEEARVEPNRDASPACSSVSPLSRSNSPFESGNGPKVSEPRESSSLESNVAAAQNGETSQYSNGHINSPQKERLSNFVKLFPPICTLDERRKYKVQFGEIYDEYNKLFDELNDYKLNYASIQKEISDLAGTPEYNDEKCRVVEAFEKLSPSYRPKKERYNFLHKVLNHLKVLVGNFDSLS